MSDASFSIEAAPGLLVEVDPIEKPMVFIKSFDGETSYAIWPEEIDQLIEVLQKAKEHCANLPDSGDE